MPILPIKFGRLSPDEPTVGNPGVIEAANVTPRTSSYGGFRALSNVSNALASRVLGAISVRDVSDNVYVYAGDSTKLYEMIAYTFTDQSVAGGYATAASDNWEFVLWRVNNKVIATNYTNAVQSIAVGGGAGGAFADMITSTLKPKAKHIGIVGRFVVLGYTNDAVDGERPNRVWWPGISDETDYDPSAATQCDFEDLADGGVVQRIVGGADYGLIFQQDAVRTMRYAGGSTVFELLPLNYAPGTPIPNSVVSYKGNVFYISDAGFMALRGSQVEHIGNNQVDRFFWNQFDPLNKQYVSSAIDPINKIAAWAFPGAGASSLPNRILLYNYESNKWAQVDVDTEILLRSETQGYTLETLDTLGTNIDDAAVFDQSLDADKWKGGAIRFGAFDQSHQLGFFTGTKLTGTITTGDISPSPGRNFQINGLRVFVETDVGGSSAAAARASFRRKRKPSGALDTESLAFGQTSTMNTNGICSSRSEAQYQQIRISLSASWTNAQGVAVDYVLRGNR